MFIFICEKKMNVELAAQILDLHLPFKNFMYKSTCYIQASAEHVYTELIEPKKSLRISQYTRVFKSGARGASVMMCFMSVSKDGFGSVEGGNSSSGGVNRSMAELMAAYGCIHIGSGGAAKKKHRLLMRAVGFGGGKKGDAVSTFRETQTGIMLRWPIT